MESITFDTPEINNKDNKYINKILEELYEYLYIIIKNDIKKL